MAPVPNVCARKILLCLVFIVAQSRDDVCDTVTVGQPAGKVRYFPLTYDTFTLPNPQQYTAYNAS